jgi:hypothetical protein
MRIRKAFQALAIIILIVSVVCAAPKNPNPGSQVPAPQIGTSIDVTSVHLRNVMAGNSNPVTADVFVYENGHMASTCGLDISNFKIDTIQMPPGGYSVSLTSMGMVDPCGYVPFISPSPNNWVKGKYTVKIYYIKAGKEKANKDFSFTIA